MRLSERGSVLMLMPAAVLVVLVLAAIAVDSAVVFLGEREAASLASAAANDAATAALREDAFRETGAFVLDEDQARRIVRSTLEASSSELDLLGQPDVALVDVNGEPAVTVTIRGTVDYIFAKAIPGTDDRAVVEASATAVARVG
jgi:hypothetical protein